MHKNAELEKPDRRPPRLLDRIGASARLSAEPVALKASFNVRTERAVMIPTRDGKRLSADMFRPDAEGRFPVIIMYHPYRKDDVGRGGVRRPLLFRRARPRIGDGWTPAARARRRASIPMSIAFKSSWTATTPSSGWRGQPWCNGNVGMYGGSYSGFTAMQVASHRPPHLKAIVPLYATDDRYTDDCH